MGLSHQSQMKHNEDMYNKRLKSLVCRHASELKKSVESVDKNKFTDYFDDLIILNATQSKELTKLKDFYDELLARIKAEVSVFNNTIE